MNQIINFNVSGHDKLIMEGKKVTTTRLCKCERLECPECGGYNTSIVNEDRVECSNCDIEIGFETDNLEKCKYHKLKPGQKVDLWFDYSIGANVYGYDCDSGEYVKLKEKQRMFLKTATVKEVFDIIVKHTTLPSKHNWFAIQDDNGFYYDRIDTMWLAHDNGFKSADEYFAYLDKKYDLSEPRKFVVVRFE